MPTDASGDGSLDGGEFEIELGGVDRRLIAGKSGHQIRDLSPSGVDRLHRAGAGQAEFIGTRLVDLRIVEPNQRAFRNGRKSFASLT
jgi:hypothetical protein